MTTNEQLYSFAKKYSGKKLSPLKSIKAYCKEQCCAGDMISWQNCTFTACLLYRYRLGIGNRGIKQKQGSITIKQSKAEIMEGGSND